jgi:hypothetical protein
MAFLKQVIAPLLIVLVFLVALAAVSARIFLPDDMAAPAPIEDPDLNPDLAQMLPAIVPMATLPTPTVSIPIISIPTLPDHGPAPSLS